MTTAHARQIMKPADLEHEPLLCPVPRPRDSVTWFEDGDQQVGTLLGSLDDGTPYIHRADGPEYPVAGLTTIRVSDPRNPVGPVWEDLPPGGLIAAPTPEQAAALALLANQIVPPGIRHRELAQEIWLRGFEVFYTGPQVRAALDGHDAGPGARAELVTTMPMDRLRQILRDMYGVGMTDASEEAGPARDGAAAGAPDHAVVPNLAGVIRIGGLYGSTDPYATVRPFRHSKPFKAETMKKASFLFGASFAHDLRFGDFSCNAVYFEPENAVLIDPAGTGLDDIAARCLRPVLEKTAHTKTDLGLIGIRVVRQFLLGYQLCGDDQAELLSIVECLRNLRHVELVAGLKAHLYSCVPGDRLQVMTDVRAFFEQFGLLDIYQEMIEPCLGEIES